jgi:hypothetical protein
MSQAAAILAPPPAAEMVVAPSVLETALAPYKTTCRYLYAATATPDGARSGLVAARGEFSIPESCYIADTGHFNAVEFNICYNQIAYCLLAHSIDHGWLDPLASWRLADFQRRQLSDCLIVQFFSSFHRPLNARQFEGRIELDKISLKRGTVFMKTSCRFRDEAGGTSAGGALIAIVAGEAPGGPGRA